MCDSVCGRVSGSLCPRRTQDEHREGRHWEVLPHLDAVAAEGAAAEHVVNAAGGSDDDVDAGLEDAGVLTDRGAANAGVALDLQVVAEGAHDLLDLLGELAGGGEHQGLALGHVVVEVVEDAGAEGGGLAGSGLGLLDHVEALAEGDNALLLDGGGLLET